MNDAPSLVARVRNSLAYRSGPLCERLLRQCADTPFDAETLAKEILPLTVVTMCGATHLLMLKQCLRSLARNWRKLPQLHVVSDGTITVEEIEQELSWWTTTKRVSHREEFVRHFEQAGPAAIARSARGHAMGAKLAIQLREAARGPILWCDADVLWFRHFDVERLMADPAVKVKCSRDLTPSYDRELVDSTLPHLSSFPFCCAGLNFLHGDILRICDCDAMLRYMETRFDFFTEQTFFAEAAYQLRSEPFPLDEIALVTEDAQTLSPTFRGKGWTARHYVTPVRHLFWRDALCLRLTEQ